METLNKEELILEAFADEKNDFSDFSTSEMAEFLNDNPTLSEQFILRLPPHRAVKTLKFLDLKLQKKLIHTLPSTKVAELIQNMHFDDRTALLSELTSESVKKLVTEALRNKSEIEIEHAFIVYTDEVLKGHLKVQKFLPYFFSKQFGEYGVIDTYLEYFNFNYSYST